jgi:hypothetical protein
MFNINFFKSATATGTDAKAPITPGLKGPAHKYNEKPEVPAGSVKVDGVKAPISEGDAGENLQHNVKNASMDKKYQEAGDKGDTKVAGQPECPKIPMGMADAKVTVPQEDGEKGKLTNPSGETADPSAEIPKPKDEKAIAGKFMEAGGTGGLVEKPKDFTADVSAHAEKDAKTITPGEKGLGKKSFSIEWVKYSAVENQQMVSHAAATVIENLLVIANRANISLENPKLASMLKLAEDIQGLAEAGNLSGIPETMEPLPAMPSDAAAPAPVANPVAGTATVPPAAPMAEVQPMIPSANEVPGTPEQLAQDEELNKIFE